MGARQLNSKDWIFCMILTIDGPTASGKSTVARLLAEQLGFTYINSGLLFRGLAYILLKKTKTFSRKQADFSLSILEFRKALVDKPELLEISSLEKMMSPNKFHYRWVQDTGPQVYLNHQRITPFLKAPLIDQVASIIGTYRSARQLLLEYQRKLADDANVVADGRDCGTAVYPHADFKFFLTASLEVRAQRLKSSAPLEYSHKTLEEIKQVIIERDDRDTNRSIAPLKPADEALIIDSSKMSVQDVIDEMIAIIASK